MVHSNKTYKVINVNTGKVLTMSDDKAITVQEWNADDNQKWRAHQKEGSWMLHNRAEGGYIGIKGEIHNGAKAVGVSEAFLWHIQDGKDETSRLVVLNTPYNLDLEIPFPTMVAVPVIIRQKEVHSVPTQIWKFELEGEEQS